MINPAKSQFGASSLEFLGHHVSEHGIHPLPTKIKAIQEFSQPQSLRRLRQFLGLINFYRLLIPHCARLVQPLTDLLAGKPKNAKALLELPPDAATAFKVVKSALAEVTLLVHPHPDAPLCLMVDASDVAVGGVLQQMIQGDWQPIAFFSKRLQSAEQKYSTFG